MGAPDKIKSLVESFHRNIDDYKVGRKNETELRREYLDPFFTELGWDVENKAGYADAYKDVIHEYSLKTKDVREAPDYCFRIGGTRKFFVEAKKPSVNVKDDIHPAFQLRSYAWSAKLSLSILTDFEEFAVYDCRIPPNKKDKASNARIMLLTYDQYIDKWDKLENIFSLDAIRKGSFDKYIESNKKKKGTAEVDEVFLEQMEAWRKSLAKNIAIRNPKLSIRELNYSVQKTIDRIIFLRICEDRGIEDYGQLMALQNGANVYDRLKQIFYRADEKYNSGLFHFEKERDRIEPPDNLTLDLTIDDKTIKEIVKELYYPDSPYEFSVLPADILGQVYEQFLGKVIRLTPAHHAEVEDKPEVKKAGGVYYTPTYIVDYIVNNTVGKCLPVIPSDEGAKESVSQDRLLRSGGTRNDVLKKVSTLKILDPACGSGSFLLGAYQYLLDWHLKYYLKELETSDKLLKQKQPPVYINDKGVYLLTTSEKKRILLNNIYGVDIDPQAVEVTKLSLMLKVLEGESTQTLNNELKFFRERALPDLSNNIKCGNSLIGPDFYNQTEMNFLDDEEKLRINVFDWHKEFPQVFKTTSPSIPLLGKEREEKGEVGFDVVIGNPPYGSWFNESEKNYLFSKYSTLNGVVDIYLAFIEKVSKLCKSNGLISFIIPSAWTGGPRYFYLRDHLLSFNIKYLVQLPFDVFKDAYVDTLIFIVENSRFEGQNVSKTYSFDKKIKLNKIDLTENNYDKINQFDWIKTKDKKIVFDLKSVILLDKIRTNNSLKLGDIVDIKRGVLFDKTLLLNTKLSNDHYLYFEGDVYRYKINLKLEKWLEFGNNLKERPREFIWFENERILLRRLVNRQQRIMAQFINETFITNKNLYSIKLKESSISYWTLLGLINSKLFSYIYLKLVSQATKDDFPQITIKDFVDLPLSALKNLHKYNLDISKRSELLSHLTIQFESAKTPTERTAIERQIQATDTQIDKLVYQLYGLTEEEIRIVEGIV